MERKRQRHRLGRRILSGGISFLLAGSLSACAPKPWAQVDCFAMDTYHVLQADADEAVLRKAEQRLNELEQVFSRTRAEAELAKLNAAGSMAKDEVSEELWTVLSASKTFAEETDSAFDPTLGCLVDLWDVGSQTPHVPDAQAIQKAQTACGIDKLLLGETVTLKDGMQLDLGAIAKGYAADQLAELLRQEGVENALLSLGGNVYAMGSKDGKPFRVGIADPRREEQLLGSLTVQDEAVVTSGDYQRYFEQNGVRYHHILDGQTGAPAESDLMAVTVVAQSAMRADAYSTALFVLGVEEGLALVEQDDTLEALFVQKDGSITLSSGLQNRFVKR